ncbi:MAG: hypothetical protein ABFS10_07970 [Bacteroidota bacterium]
MKQLLITILVVSSFGCEVQTGLSDSIYIPDSDYPELPAYTEWGYNTFGANYDRSIFIYSQNEVPLKVTAKNNELSFIMQGSNGNYWGDYMALRFVFPDSLADTYQDLLVYNDTIIDLTRDDVTVERIYNGVSEILDVLEGELEFKRSQKVFVDDVEQQIILSGYFDLRFLVNEIPSNLSNGRFDFGVNEENFYNLNEL